MTTTDRGHAYLRIGRWRARVPKHRAARIALGLLLLIRGLIPCPTTPVLLSASMLLLSKDIAWLRRWRRRMAVGVGRRRQARLGMRREGARGA